MADNEIDERELERHIQDHVSRMETSSSFASRHQKMQRLLSKMNTLSDHDFDHAWKALECVVEGVYVKEEKKKNTLNPAKPEMKTLNLDLYTRGK
jgi:hypothetical protein